MSVPASDFYELRRLGVGSIERAGSDQWTDYNSHDPGITLLEALAYAITELSYRSGFPIEDLLTPLDGLDGDAAPYPDQAFFSAREILTVNPVTPADLRRLLIDLDQVRNAALRCKACACDVPLFAWCEHDRTVLAYDTSARPETATAAQQIAPKGLYDVVLELEDDQALGDLNDRKIVQRRVVIGDAGRRHTVEAEVRFPPWPLSLRQQQAQFAGSRAAALKVTIAGPFTATAGVAPVDDQQLRAGWSDVFTVDFSIDVDGTTIGLPGATVRLYGDSDARVNLTPSELRDWLENGSPSGFVDPYRRKLAAAAAALASAKAALAAHRNLAEDVCQVDVVQIVEFAMCADIEVEPSADIDLVQARLWFAVETYLDPPVEFRSLDELRLLGVPVETIFDGPELANGFLTAADPEAGGTHGELRLSDLIARLMAVEGVVSVENLRLTAYDSAGRAMTDASGSSAAWTVQLPVNHRPRLNRRLSKLLFASRGLPFLARFDEAEDTLVALRGAAARPKLQATDLDLAAPRGRHRGHRYFPVQLTLPTVYGIGPAGLGSTATALRRAQARQLSAYLMVFDQLLANASEQVAQIGRLFSLDPGIDRTYFGELLADASIPAYGDVVSPTLSRTELARLLETRTEFLERRNRFLDHLLARFGESFADYAMLLTDLEGHSQASDHLIEAKLRFLRALPRLGHDRAKAFNRLAAPCDADNAPGLQERVNLLLGLPDWGFSYRAWSVPGGHRQSFEVVENGETVISLVAPTSVDGSLAALLVDPALKLGGPRTTWRIEGRAGVVRLTVEVAGSVLHDRIVLSGDAAAELSRQVARAQQKVLAQLILAQRADVLRVSGSWRVQFNDAAGAALGQLQRGFPTRADALSFAAVVATWAAHKRAIVVEHLLLRPKFPGDALYPSAAQGACCTCGPDDPYSFRLTYVMPGWTAPFSTNLGMRDYAERTIAEETPAHLLPKICWVGNDGYVEDPCDPLIDVIAAELRPAPLESEARCECAAEIYRLASTAFAAWFDENPAVRHWIDEPDRPDDLPFLSKGIAAALREAAILAVPCAAALAAAVKQRLEEVLVAHFVGVARRGYQFERFEAAWCAWADADARIDWPAERLADRVVEFLSARLTSPATPTQLCGCAATVLAWFGGQFRDWLTEHLATELTEPKGNAFAPPEPPLCPELAFEAGTAGQLRELLRERYAAYTEVSYRLRRLLTALGGLRNTYPRATLHDCDEGSDLSPVRLGQTALGSN